MRLYFKKVFVVNNRADDVTHVVRLVGINGHNGIQRRFLALDIIGTGFAWRVFHVVGRQKSHQLPDHLHRMFVVFAGKMSHTAFRIMRHGTAQLFLGHLFVCYRFDHIRTGDEHIARLLDHKDKIGDGR